MSTPAAVTEKVPAEYVVFPGNAGPPTSCDVQGAGTPVPGVTVKVTPLLAWPPTVTTAGPVVAPAGTSVVRLVEVHPVGVVAVPLNVTVLVPCAAPKFVPAIVTDVPTAPADGVRLVRVGGGGGVVTVKLIPLLAWPPTVTTTGPVVALTGTSVVRLV